jgi:DNA adenine methylase
VAVTVARPLVKWVGGKGNLLQTLMPLITKAPIAAYHEPFVGGGAVFFALRASGYTGPASLSDSSPDLIGAYQAVRDRVEALITLLHTHALDHGEEHYYCVRKSLRLFKTPVERAAAFIYLNKTCFNGLWRVNSKGEFNVPMGRYVNPTICDSGNLRACSAALQGADLTTWDFSHALSFVKPGETVYLDPPYVPTNETADFTRYSKANFLAADQERLASAFRQLDAGGARLILSNADHPVVRKLYRGYHFKRVEARRSINSDGAKRGAVGELIVTNF